MKTFRHLFLLLVLLTASAPICAHDRWANIADSLLRYSSSSVYLFNDSVRQWLVDDEREEGYAACYQRFYDAICQNIERAREKDDKDAVSELSIYRIYMSWQQGKTDISTASQQIKQLVDEDCKENGDTTTQHVRLACLMAHFLSSAGHYAEAERWCQHVDSLMDRKVTVYIWHNSVKLMALMTAQVGQGHLTEAWKTAMTINKRYNDDREVRMEHEFNLDSDGYGLDRIKPSAACLQEAARLAPQLLLPFLPPPPSAFEKDDIEPWPLNHTLYLTSMRHLSVLTIMNLFDLLFRINLSPDYNQRISNRTDYISMRIHDYNCYDSIPPQLSVELCRRSAMMATREQALSDTIHYLHNLKTNLAMTRWMNCMKMEQLKYGSRSASSLLHFCDEWLKKGYPLSMLPLVEEAVTAMQRDLSNEHPTQLQLIQIKNDKDWLRDDFPRMVTMTKDVPEYDEVNKTLQRLRDSISPN